MSKPGLAFGLNLSKKPGAAKPAPKKRAILGDDNDSDEDAPQTSNVEDIGGDLDDFGTFTRTTQESNSRKGAKSKHGLPTEPPKLKSKGQPSAMFGDLSSALSSRKNAEAATELDASVYEYDAVYDSLKPKKKEAAAEKDRRPKYMQSLMQAAEVRKRDALIAEEKKIAREREAEGEEFEGKEKFVTEAYKKQQEENRRLEEEEKRREEEEAKKNKDGGMSAFYRTLLNKDEQRHAEAVKAAEDMAKSQPEGQAHDEEDAPNEKTEADMAQELNEKGASIALNEDGQVVDKRQLLKGGLNLGAKKKDSKPSDDVRPTERDRKDVGGPAQFGRKQAMRERQSRMMAEQLEQSMKRSREEAEAQRQEVERSAKSRKTESEISSAKERYLARKRAAEEAKKNGTE